MNILFDINHTVDINFFKNSIIKLNKLEHKIILIYRLRGKLHKIIKYELSKYKPIAFGKHYNSFLSKVLGQLIRDLQIVLFQKKNGIDISVCFGATNAIASCINRIPYLSFEDDFEYKIPFYHANIFAARHIMPDFIKFENRKTIKYKGFKELSYLHPNYFKPSFDELNNYSLKLNKYVFIRQIDNVSLNYKDSNKYLFSIIKHLKSKNIIVVISFENDSLKEKYEKESVILQEPVEDIHSLMKFASFVISSGDTMAREACLLGTPCIYTGGREMVMNNELIEMGAMFKEDNIDDILKRIDFLSNNDVRHNIEAKINHKIETEWEDTTEVILKQINDFSRKI